MNSTDISILTQVAFKGAVEAATAGGKYDEITFDTVFPIFVVKLTEEVKAGVDAFFEEATARKAERIADGTYQGGNQANADAFTDAFGATPASGNGGGLSVQGKQNGPLPEWLFTAAAEKGVTKVWDNRIDQNGNSVEGTKKPWFKDAARDSDIPFWPPRG